MRMRTLTLRAFVTGALIAAAVVVAPVPSAQAACTFSISSVAWSPATVDDTATDTSTTLTMKATAGFPYVTVQLDDLASNTHVFDPAYARLTPVTGQAGTYRGTVTVVPGATPGSYGLRGVTTANSQCFLATYSGSYSAAQLAAFPALSVTGAQDAQAPVIASLTAGTGTYDATRGGSIPVSVRVSDDLSGASAVTVGAYAPNANVTPYGTSVTLTRSSGTARDGVWSGSLPLPGGTQDTWTYSVSAIDRYGRGTQRSDLGGFSTFTTAPPPKPTGIKAVSLPAVNIGIGGSGPAVKVTWNQSTSGQPVAASWLVTPTGSCARSAVVVTEPTASFGRTGSMGLCTVSVVARNAAGSSTGVSATAVL
ncbi:hypothetical protein ACIB24_05485 [Spongisporangium articulatum]|uniref:Ig-like domain-containing protein n=1 Tax=Spongisporangium articulatum TaxID=3362603 RepID=A0ABW8AJH6_9ACTN